MSTQGVSIIICCYNSAKRLPETLKHIERLIRPSEMQLELVIVDNRCTDDTVELTKQWHLANPEKISLTVISESKPGLTSARIAGVRAAAHDTLIFCDDDNWLAPDYCITSSEILKNNLDIALAGGCSYAVPEVAPPEWFSRLSGAWAIGESHYIGPLSGPDAFLRGAGLVVRRSAFLRLLDSGFSFIATDRRGSSLNSGGDTEICKGLNRLGYGLYFDSRLKLHHWIPKERLTREYTLRLWAGFGAGTVQSDADRITANPAQRIRNQIRTCWLYQIIRSSINLCKNLHQLPMFHGRSPEPSLGFCSHLGRLMAIWNLRSGYRRITLNRANWMTTQREFRQNNSAETRNDSQA